MRKTVMNHSLAKALMEAGMQHFDDGGQVAPTAPPAAVPTVETNGGAGPATTGSGDAGFLGTLFGQSKYNANLAPTQSSNYSGLINSAAGNALAGYGNSQGIQAQQQQLANALLAQSQGHGPNPAQAALNNSTGQNVANQAALMASQRGAGANPALIARLAAQQGAATQQQAAGQGAVLQAQQQLGAQQQLASQQAAMAQGNLSEQGLNAQLLGTGAGAQNAQNQTAVQNYGMVQGINSGVAQGNSKNASGILGSVIGGVGSFLGLAKGGKVPGKDIPDHLHHMATIYHPEFAHGARDFRSGGSVPGKATVKGDSAKNDTVPAMLSPGEEVLPRSVTMAHDAPARAAEFVRHLQDKKESPGYRKIAKSKKSLKERVDRLERMFQGGVA